MLRGSQESHSPQSRAPCATSGGSLPQLAARYAKLLAPLATFRFKPAGHFLRRHLGALELSAPELSNPFYPAIIEPVHDELARLGFRTILVTDRGHEPVELEPIIDGSLDGVILTTTDLDSQLPYELRRRGVPFVLLNRDTRQQEYDACVVNNTVGVWDVAKLLLGLGHQRIGAIFWAGYREHRPRKAHWLCLEPLNGLGQAFPTHSLLVAPSLQQLGLRDFSISGRQSRPLFSAPMTLSLSGPSVKQLLSG